jgi:heme exporter protein C
MKKIDQFLLVLVGILMPVALYFAFLYAPEEKVMGVVQRIFYFHVASAWTGLFSFLIVFAGAVLYLLKKDLKYDRLSHAGVELGVLYFTIVLITGPIWAKPVWGAWWTWDPRLTSTFVLFLIYVAYLLFRASLKDHPAVRTYAAVYGIVGFVDVPIVWMSIHWWRTIHPKVITAEKVNLDPRMWTSLLVCFAVMLLLYFVLLRMRTNLEFLRERVLVAREKLMEKEA